MYKYVCAPGSVVGIATGYGLDGAGIESRWGVRFSAPVRTGPGAHLASCTMGIGSFPRVKSGRDVTLTLQPLLVPWSRKSRAIPLPPLPLGRTACTEPQCLYTGALFLTNTYDPSPPSSAVVKKEQSYTSTPSLWAVRPVQSLSACTRVHFSLQILIRNFIKIRSVVPEF